MISFPSITWFHMRSSWLWRSEVLLWHPPLTGSECNISLDYISFFYEAGGSKASQPQLALDPQDTWIRKGQAFGKYMLSFLCNSCHLWIYYHGRGNTRGKEGKWEIIGAGMVHEICGQNMSDLSPSLILSVTRAHALSELAGPPRDNLCQVFIW